MATQMISQMDPLTDDLADDDLLVVVDSSDLTDSPEGTTKRMDGQQIIAKKLKTTTGPTVLAIGAIADGEFLKRSGSTIVSDSPTAAAASINPQTGTTYTIQASDNGKVITCSNAGAITVTVPSGLGVGFNCMVIQKGAGQVTFSPSSTTINNRQSHTKIAGQHGIVSLVADVANNFYLGGDTAA